MVGAVVGGENLPTRDGHWKVAGESDVNMGLTRGGLEGGGIAHILYMESMTKEEFLKCCTP